MNTNILDKKTVDFFKNDFLGFDLDTLKITNWERFNHDARIIAEHIQKYPIKPDEFDFIFKNKYVSLINLGFSKDKDDTFTEVAASNVFYTKSEYLEYLKKNRPLIYQSWHSKSEAINIGGIMVDYGQLQKEKWIIRDFPSLGKLSWLKYQFQFIYPKFPIPKFLRVLIYKWYWIK